MIPPSEPVAEEQAVVDEIDKLDLPSPKRRPLQAKPIKTVFSPQEKIVIHFSSFPGYTEDWIGLFPIDGLPDEPLEWKNLKNKVNGAIEFEKLPAGNYEVRGFFGVPKNNYDVKTKFLFVVSADAKDSDDLNENKPPLYFGKVSWPEGVMIERSTIFLKISVSNKNLFPLKIFINSDDQREYDFEIDIQLEEADARYDIYQTGRGGRREKVNGQFQDLAKVKEGGVEAYIPFKKLRVEIGNHIAIAFNDTEPKRMKL